MKKNTIFNQSLKCQDTFKTLKQTITSTLTLCLFNQTKEAILETDTSNFVSSRVLSQYNKEGILCPITFFSKKHSTVKYNYKIYDKELLTIICYLEEQYPKLKGTKSLI